MILDRMSFRSAARNLIHNNKATKVCVEDLCEMTVEMKIRINGDFEFRTAPYRNGIVLLDQSRTCFCPSCTNTTRMSS